MLRNNRNAFISYIIISSVALCIFLLVENGNDDIDKMFPFYLLAGIVSVAYIQVVFFFLDASRKPAFLSMISVAIFLMALAVISVVWLIYMDGEGSLGYFFLIYSHVNVAYMVVLGEESFMVLISSTLPALFMYIGILLKRVYSKNNLN